LLGTLTNKLASAINFDDQQHFFDFRTEVVLSISLCLRLQHYDWREACKRDGCSACAGMRASHHCRVVKIQSRLKLESLADDA
jgi:hypothetical protein